MLSTLLSIRWMARFCLIHQLMVLLCIMSRYQGASQRRRLEREKLTMQFVLEASKVCNMNLLTCIYIETYMHAFPLIHDLFFPKSCHAIYTSINSMDDNILCDKSANSFALYYAGVREPSKEES